MKRLWPVMAAILLTAAGTKADDAVLKSQLAGRWYDADPVKLRQEIDGYLGRVKQPAAEPPMALIVPHAGYAYSGPVAAYAYKAVAGKNYRRVIVIGVSHLGLPADVVSIPSYTQIETPLGQVPLDLDAIAQLRKCMLVKDYTPIHTNEHSVQIQLPFLQVALKNFKIVPILTGPLSSDAVDMIAAALLEVCGPDTLVVASSDFTHYGSSYQYQPFPYDANTEANLRKLDYEAFGLIISKNRDGFDNFLDRTGDTVCGRNGIRVLLKMLPDAAKPVLLKYDTSGRITGNFAQSVSYASFAVPGRWQGVTAPPSARAVAEADRRLMLNLARQSIAWYLAKGTIPDPDQLGIAIPPELQDNRGVFVTLHEDGKLRGCIGEIYASRPLYRAIIVQAINAAANDYRFPQVTAGDLKKIDIEISVLTPPEPVSSWRDIVPGRDGIIIRKYDKTAVFLPQVATEQSWDLPTTLNHLAQKAGLAPDGWQDGAQFLVFQAAVFGEKTSGGKKGAKP